MAFQAWLRKREVYLFHLCLFLVLFCATVTSTLLLHQRLFTVSSTHKIWSPVFYVALVHYHHHLYPHHHHHHYHHLYHHHYLHYLLSVTGDLQTSSPSPSPPNPKPPPTPPPAKCCCQGRSSHQRGIFLLLHVLFCSAVQTTTTMMTTTPNWASLAEYDASVVRFCHHLN